MKSLKLKITQFFVKWVAGFCVVFFCQFVWAQDELDFNYLFESRFPSFTKEAPPLSISGPVLMSSESRWEALSAYNALIEQMTAVLAPLNELTSSECKLSFKNLKSILNLLVEARNRFRTLCMTEEPSRICVEESQRLAEAQRANLSLISSIQNSCLSKIIAPALKQLVAPMPSASPFSFSAYVSTQLARQTTYDAVLSVPEQESSLAPKVGGQGQWLRPQGWAHLAADSQFLRSSLLYDIKFDSFFHGSNERVLFLGEIRSRFQHDFLAPTEDIPQTYFRLESNLGVIVPHQASRSIWGVKYLPAYVSSSRDLYTAQEHGIEFLLGNDDDQIVGFNGFFIKARKSFSHERAILPGWQQWMSGYRMESLANDGARLKYEIAIQEFRDAEHFVRLFPHLSLNGQGVRRWGPSFGLSGPKWLGRFTQQNDMEAILSMAPDFSSTMVAHLKVGVGHKVYYGDTLSLRLGPSLKLSESLAYNPAGKRAWKDFKMEISPEYQVNPRARLTANLSAMHRFVDLPQVLADSRAWNDSDSSYKRYEAELKFEYVF